MTWNLYCEDSIVGELSIELCRPREKKLTRNPFWSRLLWHFFFLDLLVICIDFLCSRVEGTFLGMHAFSQTRSLFYEAKLKCHCNTIELFCYFFQGRFWFFLNEREMQLPCVGVNSTNFICLDKYVCHNFTFLWGCICTMMILEPVKQYWFCTLMIVTCAKNSCCTADVCFLSHTFHYVITQRI